MCCIFGFGLVVRVGWIRGVDKRTTHTHPHLPITHHTHTHHWLLFPTASMNAPARAATLSGVTGTALPACAGGSQSNPDVVVVVVVVGRSVGRWCMYVHERPEKERKPIIPH